MKTILVITLLAFIVYCHAEETKVESLPTDPDKTIDGDTEDAETNTTTADNPPTDGAPTDSSPTNGVPDDGFGESTDLDDTSVGEATAAEQDRRDGDAPKVNSKSTSSSEFRSTIVKDGKVVLQKSGGVNMTDDNGNVKVIKFGDA